MKSYFLFAGEASGDLHGSHLIQALREREDLISIYGVGGPRMRQKGIECLIPMEEFQVMGFSDVLKSLPHLWKHFYQVRDYILKIDPDCVILIDYPGFNLRLARALRKKGFRGQLVQYICPTVWAHGKKRIDLLAKYYDLLLTIFPFEAEYFAHTSLKVKYIGNPLVETIQMHPYRSKWKQEMDLAEDQNLIALFPGSRLGEIQRHMPQQLEVATQLKQKYPHLHFALSCAHGNLQQEIFAFIQQHPLYLNKHLSIIPPHYHYDLMKNCKTALAKSGTVTLELALHGVPTIVHYELSPLNYLFAKYILRLQLPHYCIVNILSNKTVFPEFMGRNLDPVLLKKQLESLHFNPIQHQHIQDACQKLKQQLGNFSTHHSAAQAIMELLKC